MAQYEINTHTARLKKKGAEAMWERGLHCAVSYRTPTYP